MSRAFDCDSPNFREISRDIPHGFRSTAANMSYSLTRVRIVRERPAFTNTVLHLVSYDDAFAAV